MRTIGLRLAPIVFLMLLASGCANDATSSSAPPALPESPDGTVIAIAENLAAYRPEILWEALPESYRADINEVTKTFAEKMDPEIYDRALALLSRTVEVLKEKEGLILSSNTVTATGVDTAEIAKGMTNGLAVVQTLLSSEISTLAGLGAIDWKQFLGTTGSQVMELGDAIETEETEDPFAEIKTLKVETVDITGDTAKLRISTANHEPEEVDVVRVEGRWVPKDLADEWDANMDEARAHLEALTPEKMTELKGQAAFALAMAEGIVEQVATAETAEEFDAMVGPMIQAVMGNIQMAMPPQMEEAEDSTEEPTEESTQE